MCHINRRHEQLQYALLQCTHTRFNYRTGRNEEGDDGKETVVWDLGPNYASFPFSLSPPPHSERWEK
jgi:hypothetical protein